MSVLVVGSVNRDYLCRVKDLPRAGETLLADHLELGSGGKGGNQAVACSKLGVPTALVACIGADPYGQALLSDLEAAGVHTGGVLVVEHARTGVGFVMVADDGENSIVVAPGANSSMDPEPTRAAVSQHLQRGDVLVTQMEIPLDCVVAAVDEAERIGARIVLNLAPYLAIPESVLRLTDPLVVNEGEARAVLRLDADGEVDPREMAELLSKRCRSVVITLGGRGALVASGDEIHHVPAESVTVVDSTGAGDAFTGALAASLCDGADLLAAVRRGVAAGTFAVTRAGTQASYPTYEELPPLED